MATLRSCAMLKIRESGPPITTLSTLQRRCCGSRRHFPVRVVHLTTDRRRAVGGQRRVAIAAPLHADRGYGRTDAAADRDRDRGRGYTRRAHPNSTPGRMTDGHLSPKPIPTILSDATRTMKPMTDLTGPQTPGR